MIHLDYTTSENDSVEGLDVPFPERSTHATVKTLYYDEDDEIEHLLQHDEGFKGILQQKCFYQQLV